ncbi:Hypothetical predicted protein [Olea europaea subsp. europaea]|uniref:Uncharacterized protein n=1 Tax=Olea europaea subsp. europaea TaxID=158383 RepID=A0A8S0T1Q8_OLEEU|nr:Hypothetical predicted protein [Olea europaea subsp. europaea]
MAVSGCSRAFSTFEWRSDPDFSRPEIPLMAKKSKFLAKGGGGGWVRPSFFDLQTLGLTSAAKAVGVVVSSAAMAPVELSNKARRNCGNIDMAQVTVASWSNNQHTSGLTPAAKEGRLCSRCLCRYGAS